MSTDRTQQQSPEELEAAKDLSLQRTHPPAELPGYEAQQLLGQGAFGEVWIGVDRNTGRRVAIKFYTQRSRLDWNLLSREVEKLVFLSADRYVVQLLDVGWDADPPYYVMEYIENGSLESLLREHGTLPVGEATEMFRELAIGLLHAHGKGVLHCDLKPANILLDQDHKPRLADFGQSRLSHEQSPALGTLFYMAPEQADLEAMPDARWDVYALGAILYCLLTGAPPYRSERNIRRIETATGLVERLERYRELIRTSPPPADHRQVKGVDRPLAEIVDRCLAVDPRRRFANVQSILDALHARDLARVRNPLVFLGFVGPVLLLLVMALFGLRGYDRAMHDSEQFISVLAKERNELTARFAAQSIQGEISRYFRLAGKEADEAELHELFFPVADSAIVQELNQQNRAGKAIDDLREQFVSDETRQQLNLYLERRLGWYLQQLERDTEELKLASIFAVDVQGRMLAVAYDNEQPSDSIGYNYAYRSYFHGGPADLAYTKWEMPRETIAPIRQPHFSAAFPSTTSGLWKVAISTPIFENRDGSGEVVGILALTVNLGDFAYFRSNSQKDQFAVLIDGRQGPNRGVILQHPLFDRMGQDGRGPAEDYSATQYRVTEQQLRNLRSDAFFKYQDPLARAPGGEAYRGDWIAAIENVPLPNAPRDRDDMIVLVQEPFAGATAPVKDLGGKLKREGLWALGGVIAVIVVLWYVVMRMLSEPRMALGRRVANGSLPTPVHHATTLDAQSRPQRR